MVSTADFDQLFMEALKDLVSSNKNDVKCLTAACICLNHLVKETINCCLVPIMIYCWVYLLVTNPSDLN